MEYDLTKQEDIVKYMKQSVNESDWNKRCDNVKEANAGDYPRFWYASIVLSGVYRETSSQWGRLN